MPRDPLTNFLISIQTFIDIMRHILIHLLLLRLLLIEVDLLDFCVKKTVGSGLPDLYDESSHLCKIA